MPKLASMEVKILTVTTDCSGEKQAIAPTFRMSKNIARRKRRPRIFGIDAARPEIRYQLITRMLTGGDQRTGGDAAHAELRKRAEAEPERAAEDDLDGGGREHQQRRQFHVAGAAQDAGHVCISHGMTAPAKNICM